MIILLYLMTDTYWEVKQAMEKVYKPQIPIIKMNLLAFLFGILTEWKGLYNILKGNVKVNWLLLPAVLLAILSFIPRVYWVFRFGVGGPFYIEIFKLAEIHILLTAFSGVLLVRSFNGVNKN